MQISVIVCIFVYKAFWDGDGWFAGVVKGNPRNKVYPYSIQYDDGDIDRGYFADGGKTFHTVVAVREVAWEGTEHYEKVVNGRDQADSVEVQREDSDPPAVAAKLSKPKAGALVSRSRHKRRRSVSKAPERSQTPQQESAAVESVQTTKQLKQAASGSAGRRVGAKLRRLQDLQASVITPGVASTIHKAQCGMTVAAANSAVPSGRSRSAGGSLTQPSATIETRQRDVRMFGSPKPAEGSNQKQDDCNENGLLSQEQDGKDQSGPAQARRQQPQAKVVGDGGDLVIRPPRLSGSPGEGGTAAQQPHFPTVDSKGPGAYQLEEGKHKLRGAEIKSVGQVSPQRMLAEQALTKAGARGESGSAHLVDAQRAAADAATARQLLGKTSEEPLADWRPAGRVSGQPTLAGANATRPMSPAAIAGQEAVPKVSPAKPTGVEKVGAVEGGVALLQATQGDDTLASAPRASALGSVARQTTGDLGTVGGSAAAKQVDDSNDEHQPSLIAEEVGALSAQGLKTADPKRQQPWQRGEDNRQQRHTVQSQDFDSVPYQLMDQQTQKGTRPELDQSARQGRLPVPFSSPAQPQRSTKREDIRASAQGGAARPSGAGAQASQPWIPAGDNQVSVPTIAAGPQASHSAAGNVFAVSTTAVAAKQEPQQPANHPKAPVTGPLRKPSPSCQGSIEPRPLDHGGTLSVPPGIDPVAAKAQACAAYYKAINGLTNIRRSTIAAVRDAAVCVIRLGVDLSALANGIISASDDQKGREHLLALIYGVDSILNYLNKQPSHAEPLPVQGVQSAKVQLLRAVRLLLVERPPSQVQLTRKIQRVLCLWRDNRLLDFKAACELVEGFDAQVKNAEELSVLRRKRQQSLRRLKRLEANNAKQQKRFGTDQYRLNLSARPLVAQAVVQQRLRAAGLLPNNFRLISDVKWQGKFFHPPGVNTAGVQLPGHLKWQAQAQRQLLYAHKEPLDSMIERLMEEVRQKTLTKRNRIQRLYEQAHNGDVSLTQSVDRSKGLAAGSQGPVGDVKLQVTLPLAHKGLPGPSLNLPPGLATAPVGLPQGESSPVQCLGSAGQPTGLNPDNGRDGSSLLKEASFMDTAAHSSGAIPGLQKGTEARAGVEQQQEPTSPVLASHQGQPACEWGVQQAQAHSVAQPTSSAFPTDFEEDIRLDTTPLSVDAASLHMQPQTLSRQEALQPDLPGLPPVSLSVTAVSSVVSVGPTDVRAQLLGALEAAGGVAGTLRKKLNGLSNAMQAVQQATGEASQVSWEPGLRGLLLQAMGAAQSVRTLLEVAASQVGQLWTELKGFHSQLHCGVELGASQFAVAAAALRSCIRTVSGSMLEVREAMSTMNSAAKAINDGSVPAGVPAGVHLALQIACLHIDAATTQALEIASATDKLELLMDEAAQQERAAGTVAPGAAYGQLHPQAPAPLGSFGVHQHIAPAQCVGPQPAGQQSAAAVQVPQGSSATQAFPLQPGPGIGIVASYNQATGLAGSKPQGPALNQFGVSGMGAPQPIVSALGLGAPALGEMQLLQPQAQVPLGPVLSSSLPGSMPPRLGLPLGSRQADLRWQAPGQMPLPQQLVSHPGPALMGGVQSHPQHPPPVLAPAPCPPCFQPAPAAQGSGWGQAGPGVPPGHWAPPPLQVALVQQSGPLAASQGVQLQQPPGMAHAQPLAPIQAAQGVQSFGEMDAVQQPQLAGRSGSASVTQLPVDPLGVAPDLVMEPSAGIMPPGVSLPPQLVVQPPMKRYYGHLRQPVLPVALIGPRLQAASRHLPRGLASNPGEAEVVRPAGSAALSQLQIMQPGAGGVPTSGPPCGQLDGKPEAQQQWQPPQPRPPVAHTPSMSWELAGAPRCGEPLSVQLPPHRQQEGPHRRPLGVPPAMDPSGASTAQPLYAVIHQGPGVWQHHAEAVPPAGQECMPQQAGLTGSGEPMEPANQVGQQQTQLCYYSPQQGPTGQGASLRQVPLAQLEPVQVVAAQGPGGQQYQGSDQSVAPAQGATQLEQKALAGQMAAQVSSQTDQLQLHEQISSPQPHLQQVAGQQSPSQNPSHFHPQGQAGGQIQQDSPRDSQQADEQAALQMEAAQEPPPQEAALFATAAPHPSQLPELQLEAVAPADESSLPEERELLPTEPELPAMPQEPAPPPEPLEPPEPELPAEPAQPPEQGAPEDTEAAPAVCAVPGQLASNGTPQMEGPQVHPSEGCQLEWMGSGKFASGQADASWDAGYQEHQCQPSQAHGEGGQSGAHHTYDDGEVGAQLGSDGGDHSGHHTEADVQYANQGSQGHGSQVAQGGVEESYQAEGDGAARGQQVSAPTEALQDQGVKSPHPGATPGGQRQPVQAAPTGYEPHGRLDGQQPKPDGPAGASAAPLGPSGHVSGPSPLVPADGTEVITIRLADGTIQHATAHVRRPEVVQPAQRTVSSAAAWRPPVAARGHFGRPGEPHVRGPSAWQVPGGLPVGARQAAGPAAAGPFGQYQQQAWQSAASGGYGQHQQVSVGLIQQHFGARPGYYQQVQPGPVWSGEQVGAAGPQGGHWRPCLTRPPGPSQHQGGWGGYRQ